MILKPRLFRRPRRGHWATRGLVYFGLFNEGSGTKVFDLSGNGYNGTFVNNVVWDAGNFGSVLRLDGGTSYVNCGDITQLNNASAFTISFWMNQTVLDVVDNLFAKSKSGSEDIRIQTYSNGKFYFEIGNGADSNGNFDYSTVISAGSWHHVVMVFDGSGAADADRLKVYVDGVQVTLSYSGGIPATTADMSGYDFLIGRTVSSFDGMLDIPMIYNRALFVGEIAKLTLNPFIMYERDPIELWVGATSGGAPPATIVPQIQYLRNMGVVA